MKNESRKKVGLFYSETDGTIAKFVVTKSCIAISLDENGELQTVIDMRCSAIDVTKFYIALEKAREKLVKAIPEIKEIEKLIIEDQDGGAE